nr:hypothetical protein [Tanacetum cinerariifolium]
PSISSPTPPTPPPQPFQDIRSTSQVQPTPPQSPQAQPQSPQPQPQPSLDAGISMNLLQNLMDTRITLKRRVEHIELDKIAQALEITKLKQRVKKLERRNKLKVLKLRRLKRVRSAQMIDTSNDIVMDDVSKQGGIIANIDVDKDVVLEDAKDVAVEKSVDVDDNADIQGRKAESQAEIYKIDLEHAKKIIIEVVTATSDIITTASTTITAADVPIPTALIAAAPSRRRKGVVIRNPQETAPTSSIIIHSEAKSKDKGKGILRKQKEDKAVKRYQALKRKPQTEAQARKNMMIYLRNVVGFKMDYFKGMTYDDIRSIFEKHFDSNVAFLQKTKEQIDEEDSRALKRLNETVKRYQALKRKPQTEAQARKNMMIYLRNVVGFKMDYFKGMTYDDIRPIFEKHFDSNVAFLQKTKEQMDEEDSRALKRLNETLELMRFGVDAAMDFKENMLSV